MERKYFSLAWSLVRLIVAGFFTQLITQGAVVINEIHFRPDVKTEPAQFIELYNSGSENVDLSGWSLTNAVVFTFPAGTTIAADGFIVVAQNPAFLKKKFGVASLGPWTRTLGRNGDHVVLRNAQGKTENEVRYQLGFPWPTIGEAPGYSIELSNPTLDNNLAGSWRASAVGSVATQRQTLIAETAVWNYRKGTSEPSQPTTAWRQLDFDDSAWSAGATPIGYDPSVALNTRLNDMTGHYTSLFFRKKFAVENPAAISSLVLEALYDDGFKVWINGVNVLNRNIATTEVPFDGLALSTREDSSWEVDSLPPPATYLVPGTNVIAIQLHNILLTNSSDCFLDLRLHGEVRPASHGPTPGARNSTFVTNAPPQIRQVEHSPQQPTSGQSVRITAKVTDPDGVASVMLQYQIVDPGSYIELDDEAYRTNWVSVPMNDRGATPDALGGDDIFSAELPASLQTHRRLIRYRISVVDALGASVTVPYADDPQPNFAYFVYDGIPAWRAAIQPGSTGVRGEVVDFGTNVMSQVQAYQLVAKQTAIEESTWGIYSNRISQYTGDAYLWTGTLVFDGDVYDHIRFKARGGVWRYAMGKNAWKISFNHAHRFTARDNFGEKYRNPWAKMNWRPNIQQGDYQHRGEQGLFESVSYKLFNLAGTEACNTHLFQLRVIDKSSETGATQYDGDFWGLYLAVEEGDGPFLDEHQLPDGNYYMMRNGTGDLQNQGATAVSDRSDLNSFMNAYRGGNLTDDWWRTNLDLPRYFSFRSIVETVHDYDIDEGAGKNYLYYHNPLTGRWSIHPWDEDLTWADNMYGGGVSPFKNRVLSRAVFKVEYQNRLREIRDLLFNPDQCGQLIDEFAAMIHDPAGGLSITDADRCQWDYNPIMTNAVIVNLSKAGRGKFYLFPFESNVPKNFTGAVRLMKNYIVSRGKWIDINLANDATIPETPTVTSSGPVGFPVNQLRFTCSDYRGANAFAAMQWRLAEVTPATAPSFVSGRPRRYEINAVWESGERSEFASEIVIPSTSIEVGKTYRVRARVRDQTGRWSHWSTPLEFIAGEADNAQALCEHLRISEIMYQPPAGSEFEFIELRNTSPTLSLDLAGASLTGVGFTFPSSAVVPPNGFLLVTDADANNNFARFRAHYGVSDAVPVVGPYPGKLNNAGDAIAIQLMGGTIVQSLKYDNGGSWPSVPAGTELSLQRILTSQSVDDPTNWEAASPTPGYATETDRDHDGMPDRWEIAHRLNPDDPADALRDADSDGRTNLEEFQSGTDPRDSASRLRITSAVFDPSNGTLQITFTGALGKTYLLQARDASVESAWKSLDRFGPAASSATATLHDFSPLPLPGIVRIYRIVIIPTD
ncbi:MAG: lamin tail domain-containing protein [Verrucomicrobia bacterium]|nr:lamin tail domain-containing protein [Verrucomicrobiota bacterium]